jgi:hypothetical protein
MVTDLELTTDRDITDDHTGDLGTVTGNSNIEQQHVNALFVAADDFERGNLNKANAERKLFEQVSDEMDEVPYVDEIVTLDVDQISPRKFEVRVETDVIDDPIQTVVNG